MNTRAGLSFAIKSTGEAVQLYLIEYRNWPGEASLEVEGLSYHMIYGSQINGHFLCVPSLHLGVELGDYNDYAYNKDRIQKGGATEYWSEILAQSLVKLGELIDRYLEDDESVEHTRLKAATPPRVVDYIHKPEHDSFYLGEFAIQQGLYKEATCYMNECRG